MVCTFILKKGRNPGKETQPVKCAEPAPPPKRIPLVKLEINTFWCPEQVAENLEHYADSPGVISTCTAT